MSERERARESQTVEAVLRNYTETCTRNNRQSCLVRADVVLARAGRTELAQTAQWKMTTALQLSATPDAGPRSLRKVNDGDMCEQSLSEHLFHPFCCQYGGSSSKHYDWVKNNNEPASVMRCAISDVVFWFPGVPSTTLESASKPGVATVAGEAENSKRHGTVF